ncbi:hypothetical protein BDC45DRAFT_539348 [Circinella umbellata]|nr:hypothetical protein BDC45DRAFT_539348 [Circinella umbellata]
MLYLQYNVYAHKKLGMNLLINRSMDLHELTHFIEFHPWCELFVSKKFLHQLLIFKSNSISFEPYYKKKLQDRKVKLLISLTLSVEVVAKTPTSATFNVEHRVETATV